jgi:hypothetical protein
MESTLAAFLNRFNLVYFAPHIKDFRVRAFGATGLMGLCWICTWGGDMLQNAQLQVQGSARLNRSGSG